MLNYTTSIIKSAILAMTISQTALALPSQPLSARSDTATRQSKPKIIKQKSASEESRAERERRLKRECRGLSNAGACLGYTRP